MARPVIKRGLNRVAKFALALPRGAKRGLALAVDVGLCVLTVWLAFYLRLGQFQPFAGPLLLPALVSVLLAVPIFIRFGLYRAIFRYSGLPAMLAVSYAVGIYGLAFAGIFTFYGIDGVPRKVGLIQPILLFVLVVESRVIARLWLGSRYQQEIHKMALPQALIYGAGSAGRQLAAAMASSPEIRVVGYLDDDSHLHGNVLNGLPIHDPADLVELLLELPLVTDVLLALPSATRQRRNEILETLKPHRVAVRSLPGLSDIATGKVRMSDVQELDIYDLLGREPVSPNEALLHMNTRYKTVLVTGAGGSIGSELCRQILKTKPKQLLLVERSEFALYQIYQELQPLAHGVEILPLLASVANKVRMNQIMHTWQPHTVYHAAAYKHVPLVEHNPAEGVRNNVWSTRVCAEAAQRHGVRNFVLISTDKAVRPTNIMGATKRLAEMVLQALAAQTSAGESATCFSMVRFGNVLGSSGSVVPLFRQQIKKGGPITLTDAEMTRYFMTIPEAAQLVIQAGAMGTGGDVFVLDMGQPVKIVDLARRMVELSGLTVQDESNPQGDIAIEVTGLRPGEKLYEELLIGDNPEKTQHTRIMKAHEQFLSLAELDEKLQALGVAMGANDVPTIRSQLKELVVGYDDSNCEVVDWVHMAQGREEYISRFD